MLGTPCRRNIGFSEVVTNGASPVRVVPSIQAPRWNTFRAPDAEGGRRIARNLFGVRPDRVSLSGDVQRSGVGSRGGSIAVAGLLYRWRMTEPRSGRVRLDNKKKRARIVVRASVVDLEVDGEGTVRTLIYDHRSETSKELARGQLLKEAIALGYSVVDG